MLERGILGSGRTRGVSFRHFPNSSGWWWLISSIFLIRISCHKTTHANGYYGAWPGWAVSISVLPLTTASGFCHILTWISHGCTCVPHPKSPSHLPSHPTPLGCPSEPTLSALFHALNLDWSSIIHMVIYMFQCCCQIIPPLPSPTESKSLYICVSFLSRV